MQHYLPTIRIPSKAHVAQYIKTVYLCEDAVIRIPSDELILPIILSCCTDESAERAHPSDAPGMEHLEILLPTKYKNLWIHRDKARVLVKLLEKYFWTKAEVYIYRILTDQHRMAFKEDAIKAFYEDHYLTESIYPVGHFRRQLKRLDVKGSRAELPQLENPISYKLTKQQCMQVWRLSRHHKISLRIIAKHYQISHETTRKIIENINHSAVLKSDKKLTG
jgi:predicted DNA-binding transcriptional regulator